MRHQFVEQPVYYTRNITQCWQTSRHMKYTTTLFTSTSLYIPMTVCGLYICVFTSLFIFVLFVFNFVKFQCLWPVMCSTIQLCCAPQLRVLLPVYPRVPAAPPLLPRHWLPRHPGTSGQDLRTAVVADWTITHGLWRLNDHSWTLTTERSLMDSDDWTITHGLWRLNDHRWTFSEDSRTATVADGPYLYIRL